MHANTEDYKKKKGKMKHNMENLNYSHHIKETCDIICHTIFELYYEIPRIKNHYTFETRKTNNGNRKVYQFTYKAMYKL